MAQRKLIKGLFVALAVSSVLALACSGDDSPESGEVRQSGERAFTLQLLHAADMDGGVGALENVETFSGLLDGFRAEFPENTLVLSSGDNYVPGPRFYAAADRSNVPIVGIAGNGRGDIALLNAMWLQAYTLVVQHG